MKEKPLCALKRATWNAKLSSNGVVTSRSSTINGSYTMRVYGVKIYDLIGG